MKAFIGYYNNNTSIHNNDGTIMKSCKSFFGWSIYYGIIKADVNKKKWQQLFFLSCYCYLISFCSSFRILIGYFFMKYAFIKKADNLFFAFIIPLSLHGCYNLFVSSNFYVAIFLIIISWIIALKMFSRLKKTQKRKRKEYEKKV